MVEAAVGKGDATPTSALASVRFEFGGLTPASAGRPTTDWQLHLRESTGRNRGWQALNAECLQSVSDLS